MRQAAARPRTLDAANVCKPSNVGHLDHVVVAAAADLQAGGGGVRAGGVQV
jgi:hypothetical protein